MFYSGGKKSRENVRLREKPKGKGAERKGEGKKGGGRENGRRKEEAGKVLHLPSVADLPPVCTSISQAKV